MNCNSCNSLCIKKGFQKAGQQKFFCKLCKQHQQNIYKYVLCKQHHEELIVKLNNEEVGIRGIARLTGISKANIINKIKLLASKILAPKIVEELQEYEMDEMQTFVGKRENRCYIIYAINKTTKQVIDFIIGSRTKENIDKIIYKLKQLNPKRIFTDRLNIYPTLIEKEMHVASSYKINHIERYNLTLRTHLKRLTRKTICFSRSKEMLENCLRLYFQKNINAV